MLRVLSFTTLFPNEQQPSHGLFVRERIRALAQQVELRVVAPIPWFPRTRLLGERYYRYSMVSPREEQFGIPIYHPRFPVIPKIGKSIDGALLAGGSLRPLKRLQREFPFDVLDAHWAFPDGAAAAILARRLKVPFAITVRGDDVNIFLREFWRRPWIRWALKRADRVIALSGELGDQVVAAGIEASKVAVIPNGINPDAFHPIDRMAARMRLGLPLDRRIVLSVGRLHQSKGFPLLAEAAGRLAKKYPDLHVYIVGAPDHEADAQPAVQEVVERHQLHDRIHLTGSQDSTLLKYWYNAANVFCLPTAREGSANVLLEAMACGIPCVTTPVGGNPDAINSDAVGILANADETSMTRALDTALARNWDAAVISAHGRRRTWQTVAGECREQLAAMVSR